MAKNKFNHAWLHDHINDPYVKMARTKGYRARAAFKLIEILEQDRLLKPGMVVVDLGSAPGSWSQVLRERMINPQGVIQGKVIALDLLPMESIEGVDFFQGDFREEAIHQQLIERLDGRKVDLVVSDMAPNLSGVAMVDAARMANLIEVAIEFCESWLKPEGALLVKAFHGSGYSQLVELFKHKFKKFAPRKPKASRDKSAETFILGRELRVPHQ
jgi:23S rRNA (uridine2552-2'-O)-methyltransferase